MSNRFNVNTASREELQNAVRHLHTRVAELQQQQQKSNKTNNTASPSSTAAAISSTSVNNNANSSTTTSGVASSIANFFTGAGNNNNNNNSASPSQKSNDETSSSYFLSMEAKARLESLEEELNRERTAHHEDIEIMQRQIDELTIRAADDAEAIDKLRKATQDMKLLAKQHQQELVETQQRRNNERSNNTLGNHQIDGHGMFGEETKNVVDSVASSFASAMAGLADERDVAKLEHHKLLDENRALKEELQNERRKNSKLVKMVEKMRDDAGSLQNKSDRTDERIKRGKEVSRQKYDRLYEKFMLLKKRFESDLEFGCSSSSVKEEKSTALKVLSQKNQSAAVSSSSSSSSSSSKMNDGDVDVDHEKRIADVAVVATVTSNGPPTPVPVSSARKAVVFNAAQLHQHATSSSDDDDDDDDDDRMDHHHNRRNKSSSVIATNQESSPDDISRSMSNQNILNQPTIERQLSTTTTNSGVGSSSSLAAGIAIAKAWQQQKSRQSPQQQQQASSLIETSTIATQTESREEEQSKANDSPQSSTKQHVNQVVEQQQQQQQQQPPPGFTGSMVFDHDISVLAGYDREDIQTLRRMLGY